MVGDGKEVWFWSETASGALVVALVAGQLRTVACGEEKWYTARAANVQHQGPKYTSNAFKGTLHFRADARDRFLSLAPYKLDFLGHTLL